MECQQHLRKASEPSDQDEDKGPNSECALLHAVLSPVVSSSMSPGFLRPIPLNVYTDHRYHFLDTHSNPSVCGLEGLWGKELTIRRHTAWLE